MSWPMSWGSSLSLPPTMKFYVPLLLQVSASSLVTTAMGRTFTVHNACPFAIWPAIFTDPNTNTALPNQATGWAASASSSVSFSVPDNWNKARIWGRRNCDFSTNPGPDSCLDGGCVGGLLCNALPAPPVTVADFNLSLNTDVPDYLAVSLVNGYNLPMRIDNNAGCGAPRCDVDLGPNCPELLKGPFDPSGFPVGCKSACDAGLAPDPNNSQDCCTGSFNSAAKCLPLGVRNYTYFKNNCPNAYVYAYDGAASSTALFSCPSPFQADYTITFCP